MENIFTSHISSHVCTTTLKSKMKTITKSYKITTCLLSHFYKILDNFLEFTAILQSVARNKTYKIL